MRRRTSIRLLYLPFALAIPVFAASACASASSDANGANSPVGTVHPLLGKHGPDFAQRTVNGDATISLRALSGKVAVVDFWATWCEPCKKSFPELEELRTKYKSHGLVIVGISEDDEKAGISAFASDIGGRFPLLWDENKAIAAKWQPRTMPSTFIVDRAGTIRFVHLGYHSEEQAELEREIKSLL